MVLLRFLEAILFLECYWVKIQRFGNAGKREVDGRGDGTEDDLVRLSDVDDVGILATKLDNNQFRKSKAFSLG